MSLNVSASDASGQCAQDDAPLPNAPRRDQAIDHVRVVLGEVLHDGRVSDAEHKSRAIDGVLEGAGQKQLTAVLRRAGEFEVRLAQRCATSNIVVDDVVQQEVV